MWIKILMWVNVFLYRLTGGKLGGRMAGQSVLLLYTVGRKTGKAYITPTNYYRDGDGYVLVASNWGRDNHPAWFHNLMNHPEAIIQVGSRTLRVKARASEGDDYARLWQVVTGKNEFYIRYQQQTSRKIPIVVLDPVAKS